MKCTKYQSSAHQTWFVSRLLRFAHSSRWERAYNRCTNVLAHRTAVRFHRSRRQGYNVPVSVAAINVHVFFFVVTRQTKNRKSKNTISDKTFFNVFFFSLFKIDWLKLKSAKCVWESGRHIEDVGRLVIIFTSCIVNVCFYSFCGKKEGCYWHCICI